MKVITPKWLASWFTIGLMVILSTLIMATPFIPLVWLLWNWIAPLLGLPRLGFFEIAGLVYLLRFLQPAVALTQPADKAS